MSPRAAVLLVVVVLGATAGAVAVERVLDGLIDPYRA